jgi:hypothetical protein
MTPVVRSSFAVLFVAARLQAFGSRATVLFFVEFCGTIADYGSDFGFI